MKFFHCNFFFFFSIFGACQIKTWYCFGGIISRVQIMALASCLFFSKSRFEASFLRKQVNGVEDRDARKADTV